MSLVCALIYPTPTSLKLVRYHDHWSFCLECISLWYLHDTSTCFMLVLKHHHFRKPCSNLLPYLALVSTQHLSEKYTVDPYYSQIPYTKFAYLLDFICNPRINTCGAFAVLHGHVQSGKNLCHSTCMFPAEAERGDARPFCLGSQVSFLWSWQCHVFHIWKSFLVTLLFKMAPKHSTKVLSSDPKPQKAVTSLEEKICVFSFFRDEL